MNLLFKQFSDHDLALRLYCRCRGRIDDVYGTETRAFIRRQLPAEERIQMWADWKQAERKAKGEL